MEGERNEDKAEADRREKEEAETTAEEATEEVDEAAEEEVLETKEEGEEEYEEDEAEGEEEDEEEDDNGEEDDVDMAAEAEAEAEEGGGMRENTSTPRIRIVLPSFLIPATSAKGTTGDRCSAISRQSRQAANEGAGSLKKTDLPMHSDRS